MPEVEDPGGISASDLDTEDPVADPTPAPEDIPEFKTSDFKGIELDDPEPAKDPIDAVDPDADVPTTDIAKQLKALDPDIYKKIPGLRKALFAGPQVLEIFNTPDEARKAYQKIEAMDHVIEQTLSGNVGSFLDNIYDADPSSISKFTDNFLPTLYEKSPELFKSAVTPVFANMVRSLFAHAEREQNKPLYITAQNISKWLFGSEQPPDIPTGRSRVNNQPDPEKQKLADENKNLSDVLSKNFVAGIRSITDATVEKEIGDRLDPKNAIPAGLRKMVIKQAMEDVKAKLGSDRNHIARLMTIRQRAAKDGYADAHKQTMVDAYLSSARAVIPGIVQQIRANIVSKQGAQKGAPKPAVERDRDRGGRFTENTVDAKDVKWGSYKSEKDFLFGDKVITK